MFGNVFVTIFLLITIIVISVSVIISFIDVDFIIGGY